MAKTEMLRADSAHPTAILLMDLIRFPSVSTMSNRGVSDFLDNQLCELGFETEVLTYERDGAEKVCVVGRHGSGPGGFAFIGHTDVVPADDWQGPGGNPFEPVIEGDRIYGRGSADMKGSIACFLTALMNIERSKLGPIYAVFTSDEETGQQGAAMVAEQSKLFRDMVKGQCAAVIGEPTELNTVYAHKGSCLIEVVSHGRAGHSGGTAGINANLAMIPFLAKMRELHEQTKVDPAWCDKRFDPPTISLNIGINDHNSAVNITPAKSVCTLYMRSMPGQDLEPLLARIQAEARQNGLTMSIVRREPAYYVDPQSEYVQQTLRLTGKTAPITVNFGTDASRLSKLKQLVLLGAGSIVQAHKADEYIALDDLKRGTEVYQKLIQHWCQL